MSLRSAEFLPWFYDPLPAVCPCYFLKLEKFENFKWLYNGEKCQLRLFVGMAVERIGQVRVFPLNDLKIFKNFSVSNGSTTGKRANYDCLWTRRSTESADRSFFPCRETSSLDTLYASAKAGASSGAGPLDTTPSLLLCTVMLVLFSPLLRLTFLSSRRITCPSSLLLHGRVETTNTFL